jgi:putative hydrolase of the HAD superfamily
MIKGVIFDLGSTLIHFEGNWDQIWQDSLHELIAVLQAAGIGTDPAHLMSEFARRMHAYRRDRLGDHQERTTTNILVETLTALGESIPDDQTLADALQRMYAHTESHWKPVPGLDIALTLLQERGLHMALLSNAGDEPNVQRLIDQAGIRPYFDPILISAALGVRKPAREPFVLILSQWGFEPGEVVMVGDRLDQDVLGAQQAGLHQIWLRAYAEPNQISPREPERMGDTLSQVPALIDSLNSKG